MAASSLKQYMDRSMGILRKNTAKVMRMDISSNPQALPILSFASSSAGPSSSGGLSHPGSFALGSDADIGGLSTSGLTPISDPSSSTTSHAAFHGNLSLAVPPQYQGKIRTGYAAFRTKTRPTLFGEETWDMSLYTHLKVVVGYRGWEGWRDRWVVNLQTDGPVRSDLYQYRLPLPSLSDATSSPSPLDPSAPPPPKFSILHLPLASFVLTNSGQTASQQIPMMRTKVRTLGFALLGGGRSTEDASAPTSEALTAQIRMMGAGGWRGGKDAGDVEVDAELEELMKSDMPQEARAAPRDVPPRPAPNGGSGYHRVGAAVAPSAAEQPIARPVEADGSPAGVEGYYELCIKSVEAVKWDPEMDDGEDLD